jgi:hypothetical protein
VTTAEETLEKTRASVAAGFTDVLLMIGARRQAAPEGDPRTRAEEAAALLPRLRALG